MKKFLLAIVTLMSATFTAQAQSVAEAIAGEYTGEIYISIAAPITDETRPEETPTTLTIAADEGGESVTLSLANFEFGGLPLGDIVLPNVPVSQNADGSVTFGDNPEVSFRFEPMPGYAIEATACLNPAGSVISGGVLTANIDVMWTNVEVPVPIYVRFVSDGTSGIDSVTARPATGAKGIYTISGRRVNATDTTALPAGLYIVDGKKTLVK